MPEESPQKPENRSARRRLPVVPVVLTAFALLIAFGGVKDVGHAISNPDLRTWLTATFTWLRAGVMVVFAAFTFNRDAPARRARNPWAYLACFVAVATIVVLHKPDASSPNALILAGEGIAVLFYALVPVSVLTLRHCFGLLPEARGLVTTGPYRFVRHPVYLGELGSFVGLTIAAASPFNIAVFAAFVVSQWVRMDFEERALAAAFPEYREYARRTPRLWPAGLFRARRLGAGIPDDFEVSREPA